MAELTIFRQLERKVLWIVAWIVQHADRIRSQEDGTMIGGHQASSASLVTIMTALHFNCLRAHAIPAYHVIQYLLDSQTCEKLENFRGHNGALSHQSRPKDAAGVGFSTGSVCLGVAQTLFASLAQGYMRAKEWAATRPEGRMIALLGDAKTISRGRPLRHHWLTT